MSEFLTDDQKAEQAKTEGKALRDFAEAKAAEAKEWQAKFEALESQLTTQTLGTIWDGLDVVASDKVKAQYKGEATAEAVKKWVEENADVYRFEPKTPTEETDPGSETDPFADAQAALAAAQSLGKDKGVLGDLAARQAKLKNSSAKSPADLDSIFDGVLPD